LRLLTIILLLTTVSAYGQKFPSEFWHKGKLVTSDGDTLEGKLKYDLSRDLVQVDLNNQIFTFGAKKILYFEIFDVTVDNYRQFYSIPYNITQGYKSEILFEVLYEGKLTLLTRESVSQKSSSYNNNNYYWSGNSFTRTVLTYEFFFLTSKGEITLFTQKRKDLLDIMKDRYTQMKKYIKTYGLKTDDKGDLARITAYYNTLIQS